MATTSHDRFTGPPPSKRPGRSFVAWLRRSGCRFLVLCSARTGSNLLKTMLASHPQVRMYGEIFERLDGKDPRKEVVRFYRQRTPAAALGCKVFYAHPLDADHDRFWRTLSRVPGLRVIHLRRRNLLRRFVSIDIARQLGVWVDRGDAPSVDAGSKRVAYPPDFLRRRLIAAEQKQQQRAALFAHARLLDIEYEQLVQDPLAVGQAVIDFLRLPPADLHSPLRRQNPEPLSELIENFDELRAALAGSPWESMMDD